MHLAGVPREKLGDGGAGRICQEGIWWGHPTEASPEKYIKYATLTVGLNLAHLTFPNQKRKVLLQGIALTNPFFS